MRALGLAVVLLALVGCGGTVVEADDGIVPIPTPNVYVQQVDPFMRRYTDLDHGVVCYVYDYESISCVTSEPTPEGF